MIGGVEGVLGINQRPASYSPDFAEAPPRSYRQRKAWRGKTKYSRRAYRRAVHIARDRAPDT